MAQIKTGTVKWFDPGKAFGFLTSGDGIDVFVHRRGIADGREWLIDGQGVEFVVRQGNKGLEADQVRVTTDVAEVPQRRQRVIAEGGRTFDSQRAPSTRSRRSEPYGGPIPHGPVRARVVYVDSGKSFLFARVEGHEFDVFVSSSLWTGTGREPEGGDLITVSCERSARGPRAASLSWG